MALKLYNSLTCKKETFKPIEKNEVKVYSCGPTVYDFAHLGNLRAFMFADILKKVLEYNLYDVKHVMNITDVGHLTSDEDEGEDKMTKALKREGKELTLIAMERLGEFYAKKFSEDIFELNIEPANFTPKASEHIKENIALIETLKEKGYAYDTSDGIYFDTSKFKEYGKLGKIDLKGLKSGARITSKEKKNPTDFSLWKFNDSIGWDSPWGKGFPGWHIECSSMAAKYLGQPFDIHTGGIDHIPVHHQNEIAQSEAAHDKPLANYWLHSEFLVLDKEKMSKSKGTFLTLNSIKEKGFSPLAYRMLTLGTHYKKPLNFSWEALQGAQNTFEYFHNHVRALGLNIGEINKKYKAKFLKQINDDLNMPLAIATAHELLKSNLENKDKLATLLDFDKVLGLKLELALFPNELPKDVVELAKERQTARFHEDWKKADKLREKIKKLGYEIIDIEKDYRLIPKQKT